MKYKYNYTDDVEKFVKLNNLCIDLNCEGTTFTNTLSFFRQTNGDPASMPDIGRSRRSTLDLEVCIR